MAAVCWVREQIGTLRSLVASPVLLGYFINSQEDRGHQSSGARAPELWCPHIFFRGFLDGVLTFMLAVFR